MSFTQRFTGRQDAYVAGRPSYPQQALDVLFEGLGDPAGLVAVDLGAGTGISSRLLARRGASVVAVEPSAAMRAAAEAAQGVRWSAGTAEATGLDGASADLVTAFQAFHWFDAPAAFAEIERVLRPRGRAAVVYNERDESDAFTAAYGAVVRRFATEATETQRGDALAAFAAWAETRSPRRVALGNRQRLDRDGLHARVRSTSYLPQDGPAAVRLLAEIDAVFDAHAADGAVGMLLQTIVVTADLDRAG